MERDWSLALIGMLSMMFGAGVFLRSGVDPWTFVPAPPQSAACSSPVAPVAISIAMAHRRGPPLGHDGVAAQAMLGAGSPP